MRNTRVLAVFYTCWLCGIVFGLSPSGLKKKGRAQRPSDCTDTISSTVCKGFSKYCDTSDSLKKSCKRTCGFCREISWPCEEMPFKCCWDGITSAVGPGQKGCPACKDHHKKCYAMVSSKNCKITTIQRACPVSCGLCSTCIDDPDQADYCPLFKKSNFCKTMKVLMKKNCRKTCELCDENCKY